MRGFIKVDARLRSLEGVIEYTSASAEHEPNSNYDPGLIPDHSCRSVIRDHDL